MDSLTPIAFDIQRIGQKTERISADAVQPEGTPAKYVFRRKGEVVFDIFVQALERQPKPMYPQTSKAKVAWKAFVQKQNAINRVPHLER